jgi:hypothetical protein
MISGLNASVLNIKNSKHQITNNKQIPSASGGPMIQTLMKP